MKVPAEAKQSRSRVDSENQVGAACSPCPCNTLSSAAM